MRFDTTANLFWMYDAWNDHKIDKAHVPLYIFRNKYPQYFKLFEKYFVFSFVRNPYSRFVSAFNELHGAAYDAFRQGGDVGAYKALINSFVSSLAKNGLQPWRFEAQRFIPQVDMVYLDSKSCVDLILKVEDWDCSLKKIGYFNKDVEEALIKAPRANEKPLPMSYRDLLTTDSIKRLSEIYQNDFLLFDYKIDLLDDISC